MTMTRNGTELIPVQTPQRRWRRAMNSSSFWLVAILVVLIAVFLIAAPTSFGSLTNVRNIALDASGLLLISIGMTFVIITGGIDLSPGAVLVFSQVVAAKTMVAIGPEQPVLAITAGFLVGILVGAGWGAINGVLIAWGRIPPLVATLGTMGIALSLSLVMTNGLNVSGVPQQITAIGTTGLLGIPVIVIAALVIAALAAVLLKQTKFGKLTFAIGSNVNAVRRAGMSEKPHLLKVYLGMGALAGLAGILEIARFGTTAVNGHSTDALQAIAAVVIGGTSLFGGVGSLLGTLIGVFIPAVLRSGFLIVGLGAFWQQAAVGAVLIAAVYWDQLKRKGRLGSKT